MDKEDQTILEQMISLLPIIQTALDNEIGIAVADREKILIYQPAKNLDLRTTPNTPLREGTASYRIVHEGLPRITAVVEKPQEGLTFIAKAAAVNDHNGRVIGSIIFSQSIANQLRMKNMANKLAFNISTLASTTEEITAQSQEMTRITRELSEMAEESKSRVSETNEVLGFIKQIAGQTNLLGLNAAIEAARVGEQGRGFGVVAEEIRKLAASSTESVAKINQMLGSIQRDSTETGSHIRLVEEGVNQVTEAISQLAGATEELRTMAETLEEVAHSL